MKNRWVKIKRILSNWWERNICAEYPDELDYMEESKRLDIRRKQSDDYSLGSERVDPTGRQRI